MITLFAVFGCDSFRKFAPEKYFTEGNELKFATAIYNNASQATATRGDSLDDLLKKEVKFRIIEVNRGRRRAVGSITVLYSTYIE